MSTRPVDIATLVAMLPEAAVAITPGGEILAANAALARLLEYAPGALVGRRLLDLADPAGGALENYVRRCSRSRSPLPGRIILKTASGTTVACRGDGAAIGGPEKDEGLVLLRLRPKAEATQTFTVLNEKIAALTREITLRRQAQAEIQAGRERLQLALDAAQLGIWDFYHENRSLIGSERMLALFDLPAGESRTDVRTLLDRVHPDDRKRLRREFKDLLRAGAAARLETELRVLTEAGERWLAVCGRALAAGRRVGRLIGTVQDITGRRRAERMRALLLAELSHRVKNTLATVQTIIKQTLRKGVDPEASCRAIQGRLRALAHTHSLLTESDWIGANLRRIVETELAPFPASGVAIKGPEVLLRPKAAQLISLIIHELVSNAAKYGALSQPGGRVEIRWEVAEDDTQQAVRIIWTEGGGPRVAPPERKGFGIRLIERAIAYELAGQSEIEYRPEGLRCRVAFTTAKTDHWRMAPISSRHVVAEDPFGR